MITIYSIPFTPGRRCSNCQEVHTTFVKFQADEPFYLCLSCLARAAKMAGMITDTMVRGYTNRGARLNGDWVDYQDIDKGESDE